jgi:hypothetical protein
VITQDCYFRLAMVDLNGNAIYSPIVRLSAPATGLRLSITSSNPAIQSYLRLSINVPGNENGELSIINDVGRILKVMPVSLIKGSNTVQVGLYGISSGYYFIRYSSAAESPQTIPFVNIHP